MNEMKLIKKSQNFTPLHQGLLFGIDTEAALPSDLMVEIVDTSSSEVIATQQLRGVVSAEVNVVPYLKRFTEYQPTLSTTGFEDAPTRACAIRVGENMSEKLLVSINKSSQSMPAIVTTMPDTRRISPGESDELLLFVEAGDNLVANIETDTGETLTIDYTTVSGAVVFAIFADDFDSDSSTIAVEILRNGEHLTSLLYTLHALYKGGCRLAWISDEGAIERYTFPIVAKRTKKSDKLYIGSGEHRRMVRSSSETEISLLSRYEPSAVIEPLTRIISSERVWIEHLGRCREVTVVTSAIDSNLFGEPDRIELVISEWSRGEAML